MAQWVIKALHHFLCNCYQCGTLKARGFQRSVSRQSHHKAADNFHNKYGNAILITGVVFCTSIWTYVFTQTGVIGNLSPIGRITPRDYKEE